MIDEVEWMEDLDLVSENQPCISGWSVSPPPSPFHGFDPSEIPAKLVIKTRMIDKEEVFESIRRAKKGGGKEIREQLDEDLITSVTRREKCHAADPPVFRSSKSCILTPKVSQGGTGSRPMFYLVGSTPTQFRFSKLPTTEAVLGRFLSNLEARSTRDAAVTTRNELKDVWLHHFSAKLVQGRELGIEEKEDEKCKVIKQDRFIDDKIIGVWKVWRKLEEDSRRLDRSSSSSFLKKEEEFKNGMKKPFDISKVAAEDIIKNSGIKDWKEEFAYLQNQLSEQQPGCPGSFDQKQKNRDNRLIEEIQRAESNDKKTLEVTSDLLERKKRERDSCEGAEVVDNNNDEDFIGPRKKKRKIDIMGKISLTSDRVNVSYQARAMIAASTVNALGGDVYETNISKTSAWRKAHEVRTKTAVKIKAAFKCPDKVTAHWDGKTLTLKGNIKSNRVCVYLTGADALHTRKLLGVPETPSGTGYDEAKIVTDLLMSWDVLMEVIGMVFDTTSSNTGAENGACKFIEEWRGSPVLWLACRHHVAELHISRVVHAVTGNTKDPGVGLFRRLKKKWAELEIDLENLVLFDSSHLDEALQAEAEAVLAWAQEQLQKKTWPREDYLELLELLVITLGGTVLGFTFKMPGADHHARWMSKAIYYLKIRLLCNIFELSLEEKHEVDLISEFTVLFYVKYWLQTPLPSAAARIDLDFMINILHYRLTRPKIAFAVLQSSNRHLWYLTPQLITLALADHKLEVHIREKIAKAVHSCKREDIASGKPAFPVFPLSLEQMRQNMDTLVTSDSWLVFQLLGLDGPQDWLQTPASLWHLFAEFKKFKELAFNISVTNDIAERGIHLMSDFISHCETEDQRQALFQCVEYHRELVPNTTKKNLKFC